MKKPAIRKIEKRDAPAKKEASSFADYAVWFGEVREEIRRAQIKAVVAVNSGLIRLYWSLGERIAALHETALWGSGFFRKLSADLRREFPDAHGFSESNLRYMSRWHDFYAEDGLAAILHQLGEEIHDGKRSGMGSQKAGVRLDASFVAAFLSVPWRHHVEILTHSHSLDEAAFYISKTAQNNWSRAVLLNFLDTDLFERQGRAVTNFSKTLPAPEGDLASELLKDPYNFDFLSLSEKVREKELEDALVRSITEFLIELGSGFAYVGRQIELEANGDVVRPDLLFYHLGLRCFVVVELKVVPFDAAFVGQLGLYVSAVNHLMRKPGDAPTIGLLICKSKNDVLVRWALEGSPQPIGVSAYRLSKTLAKQIAASMPTIEQIEAGISR